MAVSKSDDHVFEVALKCGRNSTSFACRFKSPAFLFVVLVVLVLGGHAEEILDLLMKVVVRG